MTTSEAPWTQLDDKHRKIKPEYLLKPKADPMGESTTLSENTHFTSTSQLKKLPEDTVFSDFQIVDLFIKAWDKEGPITKKPLDQFKQSFAFQGFPQKSRKPTGAPAIVFLDDGYYIICLFSMIVFPGNLCEELQLSHVISGMYVEKAKRMKAPPLSLVGPYRIKDVEKYRVMKNLPKVLFMDMDQATRSRTSTAYTLQQRMSDDNGFSLNTPSSEDPLLSLTETLDTAVSGVTKRSREDRETDDACDERSPKARNSNMHDALSESRQSRITIMDRTNDLKEASPCGAEVDTRSERNRETDLSEEIERKQKLVKNVAAIVPQSRQSAEFELKMVNQAMEFRKKQLNSAIQTAQLEFQAKLPSADSYVLSFFGVNSHSTLDIPIEMTKGLVTSGLWEVELDSMIKPTSRNSWHGRWEDLENHERHQAVVKSASRIQKDSARGKEIENEDKASEESEGCDD